MVAPPRKILLATDLSARSDRAQDRAVLLMKQFKAELLALYVIEPNHTRISAHRARLSPYFHPDKKLVESAVNQVYEYLHDIGKQFTVRIEKGETPRVILRVAREEQCDIIVTGVARNEILGRITLGKTVDRLMHESEIPILIVTERARAPYRHIIVTSDFSEISRHALEMAVALFPEQKITILHSHASLGSWATEDLEGHREQMRKMAYLDYQAFIKTVDIPQNIRARIELIIESGDPAHLLQELAQRSELDLLVAGSKYRGFPLNVFFSSTAKRVVSAWCCDALIVRDRKSW